MGNHLCWCHPFVDGIHKLFWPNPTLGTAVLKQLVKQTKKIMSKKSKGIFLSTVIAFLLWYLAYTLVGGGPMGIAVGVFVAAVFHKWMVWPVLGR